MKALSESGISKALPRMPGENLVRAGGGTSAGCLLAYHPPFSSYPLSSPPFPQQVYILSSPED